MNHNNAVPIKGTIQDVLDHGFVRLVDYMGSDISIVRAARVSYDADWRTGESEKSDEKLISYLVRNRHTSPFESVIFTFEIKCPIFIVRQWHRHRTWSYNEVSARYTRLPEEFYVPEANHMLTQNQNNKQGVSNIIIDDAEWLRNQIIQLSINQFDTYKRLLQAGLARELARMVLPLNTYTRFFGTVNLHNLFHFLKLRLHPHAQWEIREYAQALFNLCEPICPVAFREWAKTEEHIPYKDKE